MAEEDKVITPESEEQESIQEDSIGTDGNDGGRLLSSKNAMVAIFAVAGAFFCYKMFIAPKENIDVVDTDSIVMSGGRKTKVNAKNDFEDVDSLIGNGTAESVAIDQLIPTVPDVDIAKIEVPDLSEDLKNSIEKEIEREIDSTSEYFTKEQVDDLINDKLIIFEAQMNAMKDESNKLAKKLKETEQKMEEDSKKAKEESEKMKRNLIFAASVGGKIDTGTNNADPNDPFAFSDNSYEAAQEEARKKEEEEIKKVQRNKALTERRASPMFKMQGGGGGESAMDQDSIIILDKNLLIDVKDNVNSVVPTKTQDLSRVILQGKVIEAALETAINTDVVSQVRAVVTRDIYAEYGKNILIPKGSRIVGTFSSNVTAGVARLGIVWNRIIRVDGLSLNISANAADQIGRGGVEGDLDNKYFQTLRNSFLSSLITIATTIAVDEVANVGGLNIDYDKDSGVTTYSGDATAYAVREATSDFMDDVEDIIDNMKEEKPTIRIAQGTKVVVVVNQDLTLPIYKKR